MPPATGTAPPAAATGTAPPAAARISAISRPFRILIIARPSEFLTRLSAMLEMFIVGLAGRLYNYQAKARARADHLRQDLFRRRSSVACRATQPHSAGFRPARTPTPSSGTPA